MKDLYSENYKKLMKKFENDTKKWKDTHVLGLEEIILLRCPYNSKQSTGLMQFLSKYP